MKNTKIILLKTLIGALSILLLTSCGKDNTKGKQNSTHGLINNPPVGEAQKLSQEEDASLSITLRATDPDGDTLGYRVTTPPQHGTLKGKAPKLTYVPNKDYNGKESFGFVANDGVEDSKETTVSLDISPVADLKKLTLTVEKEKVNKESTLSYTLTPSYDEGKIPQALKDKVNNYVLTANTQNAIEDNKTQNIITVLKDGNLTLQAKVDNITSNPVALEVYWEVNGHRLPPEPDLKINNSTFLGIDSNNNGVRDDVERWIYEKYGKMHPVNVAVGMEAAKVYQKIIDSPKDAKNHNKVSFGILDCEEYLHYDAPNSIKELILKEINNEYFRKSIIFNTKDRKKQYEIYGYLLSGSIFATATAEEGKAACLKIPSVKKVLEGVLK